VLAAGILHPNKSWNPEPLAPPIDFTPAYANLTPTPICRASEVLRSLIDSIIALAAATDPAPDFVIPNIDIVEPQEAFRDSAEVSSDTQELTTLGWP
jgi:hypothetical protein